MKFFNPRYLSFLVVFILLNVGSNQICRADIVMDLDDEARSLLRELYQEKGDGWLCYWQLNMPGAPSSNWQQTQSYPGMSGISTVQYVTEKYDGIDVDYISINNFAGDYRLRIEVGITGDFENTISDLMFYDLIGTGEKNGKIGSVFPLPPYTISSDGETLTTTGAEGKYSGNGFNPKIDISDVKVHEGEYLEFIPASSPYGYGLHRDSESENVINGNKLDGNLTYFSSIKVVLFKSNAGAIGKTIIGEKEREYAIYTQSEQKYVDVVNMYGKGVEFHGDMLNYNNTHNQLSNGSVRINLIDDGSAELQTPSPGMFTVRPVNAEFTLIDDKLTFTIPNQSLSPLTSNMMYLKDYIIITERGFENIKPSLPDYYSSNSVTEAFKTKLDNQDFEAPIGSWSISEGEIKNQHWDNKDGSKREGGTLQIEFPSHILLPVYYYFNQQDIIPKYLSDILGGGLDDGTGTKKAEKVDAITLQIPLGSSSSSSSEKIVFDFQLQNYGNDILEHDERRYLYIEGKLISSAENTRLFIKRDKIEDFDSEDLSDTENGSSSGLYLDITKYTYTPISQQKKPLKAEDGSTYIQLLIPDDDIPGSTELASSVYTIYGAYSDNSGKTRFRVLSELTGTTTGVSDQTFISKKEGEFDLSGNVLKVTSGNAQIFDTVGHLIGTFNENESVKLPAGIYIIRQNGKSQIFVIAQ